MTDLLKMLADKKPAPPFSADAMAQIEADLRAHDAGDKGATECLEGIGPDLARRMLFVEFQASLAVDALRLAEGLRDNAKRQLAEARAENAQLLKEREAACQAEAKANDKIRTLEAQLEALRITKPPAKERIEAKLKGFNA